MDGSLELFLSSLLELSFLTMITWVYMKWSTQSRFKMTFKAIRFVFFPFSFHQGLQKVVHPVKVQDDLELSSCFLYLHFLHLFPFSYHQGSHEPVDQVEVQDDLQDHDGRQEEGPDLHAVVQSGVRIGEASEEASGHRDSSHQPDHLQDWAY